jgi:hypothetical protein
MAGELGLVSLAPQRGWEALRAIDWSIQKPRPRNPKAATLEEQDDFKKRMARRVCKGFVELGADQSASTYPASRDSLRP